MQGEDGPQAHRIRGFLFRCFLGIEEDTARSGRHTLFTYLDDFDVEEVEGFRAFLRKVDGVIVEEARNPEFLQTLKSSGVPTVLLAPTETIDGLDLVTMDLASGVRKAVGYLRGLGHRRIAIINGPLRLESARIRFLAWQEAMAEAGGSWDELLVDGDEGWSAEAGLSAMNRLLERNAAPYRRVLRERPAGHRRPFRPFRAISRCP